MKSTLFTLATGAFLTALLAFTIKEVGGTARSAAVTGSRDIKKSIIRCTPDWNELNDWLEEVDIPRIPGAGVYKWKISTTKDSAQFYFNQGINMYYGFHIIEAMASFKKAARFDPNCAMLYWAQALGYGPNINDYGYRASPEALAAISKAVELEAKASPMEKALIDAMAVRYTADSADATRAQLNQDYTDMMKKVYDRFPGNPDAQALYADAMMLQHPWDLWNLDGSPKPWTPRIRQVLEKLLAVHPNHPAANHYYIHVMEGSPFAEKALPSAGRLGITNPGLSHLVHMPSHIYLRTGKYKLGITVNTNAVKSYKKMIPLYAPVTSNDFLYAIHNLHMKANNAMLAGQYSLATDAARETRESIPVDYLSIPPPLGNYIQYIYMTPELVKVRFGKWDELLNDPTAPPAQVYARILYHFSRGMAYAGKSEIPEAIRELGFIMERITDSTLFIPMAPFSPVVEGAKVAERMLRASIVLKQGNKTEAIRLFTEAVTTEENMVYTEPRDWILNPRHYLANALLENGQYKEARDVLAKDLLNNKENGWALYGIWLALSKEKKTAEAAKMLARYKLAFDKNAVKLTSPVY